MKVTSALFLFSLYFSSLSSLSAMNAGSGVLVWTSSAYSNGSNSSMANTTNSLVNFNVVNNPTTGNYINSSPATSMVDFAAGGLYLDHDDGSTGVISMTTLTPNLPLAGVSFVIGDIDSNGTLGKLDGVIVSATSDTGATVYPIISAGNQLSVTGNPGEVVSTIGPNNGQDDPDSQALFIFSPGTHLSQIQIDFANYGNVTDDQHISIADISWQSTTPEPQAALLGLIAASLVLFKRSR